MLRAPGCEIFLRRHSGTASMPEEPMLDVSYLVAVIGLFGLIALVARGVEKL